MAVKQENVKQGIWQYWTFKDKPAMVDGIAMKGKIVIILTTPVVILQPKMLQQL